MPVQYEPLQFHHRKLKGHQTCYSPWQVLWGVQLDIGGYHYALQDEAFIDAVKNQDYIENDVKNSLVVHKILDAIYESAENDGLPIDL